MVHHIVTEVGYDGHCITDCGLWGTRKVHLPWLITGEDISCTMYCPSQSEKVLGDVICGVLSKKSRGRWRVVP